MTWLIGSVSSTTARSAPPAPASARGSEAPAAARTAAPITTRKSTIISASAGGTSSATALSSMRRRANSATGARATAIHTAIHVWRLHHLKSRSYQRTTRRAARGAGAGGCQRGTW